MRYPLIAFLFVFVVPLATAHALVNGGARIAKPEGPAFSVAVASNDTPRVRAW